MSGSLSEWFDLYQFPGGRRELAQRQVGEVAREEKWRELVAHCAASVEHEQRLRHQKRELARVQTARVNPRLTALDPQIDRTVGAIYRIASEAPVTIAGDELAAKAVQLVERVFPRGASAVTTLPYVEEHAEVNSILELLQGELEKTVTALGLGIYVAQLAKLNAEFGDVLAKEPKTTVSPDQVRAAEAEGQERLLRTVAMILGRYCEDTDSDVATRSRLLRPVAAQDEAIGAYFRARRPVRDVDPASGQETDPPAPAPATGTPVPA